MKQRESGFGGLTTSLEEVEQAKAREKQAEAKAKLAAIKQQVKFKAQQEADKLKLINKGATDFLKNERKNYATGKLNKGIQDFNIGTQAGGAALKSLKDKRSAPPEALDLHDSKDLEIKIKDLLDDLQVMVGDEQQAA